MIHLGSSRKKFFGAHMSEDLRKRFRLWKITQDNELKVRISELESKKDYKSDMYWFKGMLCVYCGCFLTRRHFTRDHVVPRNKGGLSHNNLVPCCKQCNRRKAEKSVLLFIWEKNAPPKIQL